MSKSKKFIYKEGITKKHEVLKEVMKHLSPITLDVPTKKSKQFDFVCQCINETTNENALDFNDKSGLLEEIKERLDPEITFDAWLFRKHKVSYEDQKIMKDAKFSTLGCVGCKACTKSSFLKMNKDKL